MVYISVPPTSKREYLELNQGSTVNSRVQNHFAIFPKKGESLSTLNRMPRLHMKKREVYEKVKETKVKAVGLFLPRQPIKHTFYTSFKGMQIFKKYTP